MDLINQIVLLAMSILSVLFGGAGLWKFFTIKNENKKLAADIDLQVATTETQRSDIEAKLRAELLRLYDKFKEEAAEREALLEARVGMLENLTTAQQNEITTLRKNQADTDEAHTVEIAELKAEIVELKAKQISIDEAHAIEIKTLTARIATLEDMLEKSEKARITAETERDELRIELTRKGNSRV